jgi:hypothetical protein
VFYTSGVAGDGLLLEHLSAMLTNMDTRTAPRQKAQALPRALIVAEGLITLYAVMFLWPIGGVLVLGNIVGALVSRGVNRWMFTVLAAIGAIVFAVILLFGLAPSTDSVTTVVPVPS